MVAGRRQGKEKRDGAALPPWAILTERSTQVSNNCFVSLCLQIKFWDLQNRDQKLYFKTNKLWYSFFNDKLKRFSSIYQLQAHGPSLPGSIVLEDYGGEPLEVIANDSFLQPVLLSGSLWYSASQMWAPSLSLSHAFPSMTEWNPGEAVSPNGSFLLKDVFVGYFAHSNRSVISPRHPILYQGSRLSILPQYSPLWHWLCIFCEGHTYQSFKSTPSPGAPLGHWPSRQKQALWSWTAVQVDCIYFSFIHSTCSCCTLISSLAVGT